MHNLVEVVVKLLVVQVVGVMLVLMGEEEEIEVELQEVVVVM